MLKTKKIGRNEKCPCNSGKKYKTCCLNKERLERMQEMEKYTEGHETSSDQVQECVDFLRGQFPDHKAIDISNYLDTDSYETFQLKNFRDRTFMVAERNENNTGVFETRGPEEVNMMIMYMGAYRCFEFKNFDRAQTHIYKMYAEQHNN